MSTKTVSQTFYAHNPMFLMANYSFLLPLSAGAIIAAQISSETKIRETHGVLAVAFFAFTLAFFGCLIWALWAGINPIALFKEARVSQFMGGPARVIYLVLMTISASAVSNSNKMCLVVAGQLVTGALIDHFGLLGTKPCKIDWQTAIGILGLFLSLLLILKRSCG